MPIIDFHAHLPVPGFDPQFIETRRCYRERRGAAKLALIDAWTEEYDRRWRLAWGFPEPGPPLPAPEAAERWYTEARSAGLSRVVFVTGGGNDALAGALAPYGDLLSGFAHHPPEAPGAAAELAQAVDSLGLVGYKVFAPLVKRPLADRSLEAVWETAEERRLPVLVHCGILGGGGGIASGTNISPLSVEPVAKAFPGITFVIPHFGCGYLRDLLQLCWACANVSVDTSGNNEWLRWYPYPLTLEDLFGKFYETVGPRRIIFGSDSSWFPRGFARPYLDRQLQACRRLGLPEEEIALIFGGNAARLLEETKHA